MGHVWGSVVSFGRQLAASQQVVTNARNVEEGMKVVLAVSHA